MGDELTNLIRRLPHWFRSFCKWLWGKRLVTCLATLWTLIILPLLVNIASSFITTPYSNQNFHQAPLIHVLTQLFDDPRNIVIIILILLLLIMLMYFGSHDNVGVAGEQKEHKAVDKKEGGLSRLDKKLKRSYLEYMIEKNRSFK